MKNFFYIFFLISLCLNTVQAKLSGKCGEYEGEGYLIREDKKIFFVLDKDSESEVKVKIEKVKLDDYKYHIDTKMKLRFSIYKSCEYKCNGTIVKIVKSLEPYEKPKIFSFPRPKPIKEIKCR
ncbi:hypothetical protein OAT67_08420 [Bacteriovoracaceae bacterium]|nr:hypothetical protein [Bacteriovoracaceae bacterium]